MFIRILHYTLGTADWRPKTSNKQTGYERTASSSPSQITSVHNTNSTIKLSSLGLVKSYIFPKSHGNHQHKRTYRTNKNTNQTKPRNIKIDGQKKKIDSEKKWFSFAAPAVVSVPDWDINKSSCFVLILTLDAFNLHNKKK